ncbi:FCD domain-containing protein [Mannheimia cairinae]
MTGLNIHFDRARTFIFKHKPSMKTVEEHKEILTAIRKKNKNKAKECIERHLHQYILDKEQFEKEYSYYFNKSED